MDHADGEGGLVQVDQFVLRVALGADHLVDAAEEGAGFHLHVGVLEAQKMLSEKYGIAADVYSVTSYKTLYTEALACERWNMLNPTETAKVPYVTQAMKGAAEITIAASDYMKAQSDLIRSYVPGDFHSLGTDGFGRSESREALRDFFEVSAPYIVQAALTKLTQQGKIKPDVVAGHMKEFGILAGKLDPWVA